LAGLFEVCVEVINPGTTICINRFIIPSFDLLPRIHDVAEMEFHTAPTGKGYDLL
jgi:hypothetical protein